MTALPQKFGLGLLGLALPLAFHPGAEDAYRLPQLIVLSLACACLAPSLRPPADRRAAWLGAAFFAWRLLSGALAGPRPAWMLEQGLYAFAFYWGLGAGPGALRRLVPAMLAGACLGAAYGLLQSFGMDPLGPKALDLGFGLRSHGAMGNPNFWAGYLLLALPFAYSSAPPAVTSLLLLSLLLTQTRGAWLGLAVAGALLLRRDSRGRKLGLAAAVLVGLAFGSLRATFHDAKAPLAGRLSDDAGQTSQSVGNRLAMASYAFQAMASRPLLGWGGGNYPQAHLEFQARREARPYLFTRDAHNDWLQTGAESGLAALLLLALLFAYGLRRALSSPPLAAALAGLGLHALMAFPLGVVPSAALFWLLLGIACAGPERAGRPAPAWLRAAAAAFCLACFAAGARQLHSSVLLNRGMSLSLAGRPAEAVPLLKAAAILRPDDHRIWMRLGMDLDQAGDARGAELGFRAALEALPGLPEAWSNLGLVLGRQNRLDEAKAASLKALHFNPSSKEAWGNLGKIEYLGGRVEEAEKAFEQALDRAPEWSVAHFNLAAIYLNTGRARLARPHLEAALKADPGHAEAARLLRALNGRRP